MANIQVLKIEPNNMDSVLVYGIPQSCNPNIRTHIFNVQKNGDLHRSAEKAMNMCKSWEVDMEKFTSVDSNPYRHDELVSIDMEEILFKAIETAKKARFSVVNSMFAESVSDEDLQNHVRSYLGDNIKVYEADIMTKRYVHHHIKPLYAEDEIDAFKVALSVLHQKTGREVAEEELLSCSIFLNGKIVLGKVY